MADTQELAYLLIWVMVDLCYYLIILLLLLDLILSIYANSLPKEIETPLPIRSACHVPRSKNYVDLLAIIEGHLELALILTSHRIGVYDYDHL